MNQTSLNLVAISIFLMTISVLVGPLINLSPAVPALATITILSIATVDSWGLQGRGGTVLLDWIASFSPEYRDRIIHHEAGHFIVAQLLGICVTDYTLTAWETLRQGRGGQGGVSFDDGELASQLDNGQIGVQMLDRYCTIWMAGIVAETLVYDRAQGGADDRSKLVTVLTSLGFSESAREQKQRFCALQAKTLLQDNWLAYQALVKAMRKRASVVECQNSIQELGVNSPLDK
jgi:hypothetical protein